MKQLENLDEKIPHPDVESLKTEEEKKEINQMPTYRRLLKITCLNARAKDMDEADRCDQVRLKLKQIESTILLEDAEFNAMFDRIRDNQANLASYNYSRMLDYMREAEKKKIEVSVKSKNE